MIIYVYIIIHIIIVYLCIDCGNPADECASAIHYVRTYGDNVMVDQDISAQVTQVTQVAARNAVGTSPSPAKRIGGEWWRTISPTKSQTQKANLMLEGLWPYTARKG